MWIGVLWAGLWVAMWITHVGGKFRHGLLEKSPNLSALKVANRTTRHGNSLMEIATPGKSQHSEEKFAYQYP